MPYSLPQSPDFSHIAITQFPHTTPPYARPKARFFFGFIALALIASTVGAFVFPTNFLNIFVFSASFLTIALIGCTIFYSIALISWRAFRIKRIVFDPKLGTTSIAVGASTILSIDLQNPLPWALTIDLISSDHTVHLGIDDSHSYPIQIPSKTAIQLTFTVHAKSIGPAGIVGFCIVLGDGHDMFRGEAHVETNLDIDVVPVESFLPARQNRLILAPFAPPHSSAPRPFYTVPIDAEQFEHKPYTAGDSIRHIDWRALARSRQLYVYKPIQAPQIHTSIIVDARSLIGQTTAPSDNIFAGVAAFIDQTANDFASFTIYVDDPRSPAPTRIAHHATAPQAHRAISAAIIDALSLRPTRQLCNEPFARTLASDFLRYHQVDFTRNGSLDIDALCLWFHLERQRIAHSNTPMPPFDTAIQDIPMRRNWPASTQAPIPIDATKTIAAIDANHTNRLFWFSDFAAPLHISMNATTRQTLSHTAATAIVCRRASDSFSATTRQNAALLPTIGFDVLTGTIDQKKEPS